MRKGTTFRRWRDAHNVRRRLELVCLRAVNRVQKTKMRWVFHGWLGQLAGMEAAAQNRHDLESINLLRNLEAIVHRRIARHFRAWLARLEIVRREWVAEEHMLACALETAFECWLASANRHRELRDGMMQVCLSQAVSLIRSAFLAMAHYTADVKRQRSVLQRSVAYFMSGITAAAFGGWLDQVFEAREAGHATVRAIFSAWKLWSIRSGSLELRAYQLVLRWRQRYQVMAWRRWLVFVAQLKQCRRLVGLLQGKRMAKKGLEYFHNWLDFVDHCAQIKMLMAKALHGCQAHHLRKAFNSWVSMTQCSASTRHRVLVTLTNLGIKKAFQTWSLSTGAAAERKRKLVRVVAILTRNRSSVMFWRWAEHVTSAHELRRQAVLKMFHCAIARALEAWKTMAALQQLLKRKMTIVLKRWICKFMRATVDTWRDRVCARLRAVRILRMCVMRVQHAAMAMAWTSWLEYSLQQRDLSETANRFGYPSLHRPAYACWLPHLLGCKLVGLLVATTTTTITITTTTTLTTTLTITTTISIHTRNKLSDVEDRSNGRQ